MAEPIKVGDLVMVVRAHCGTAKALGRVFTAPEPIKSWTGMFECGVCHSVWPCNENLYALSKGRHVPQSWLKRIPPLSELEGEKRDEEITA